MGFESQNPTPWGPRIRRTPWYLLIPYRKTPPHGVHGSVDPTAPLSLFISLDDARKKEAAANSSFLLLCSAAGETYRHFSSFLLQLRSTVKEKTASLLSASLALCKWHVSTRLLAGKEKGQAPSPKQKEQTTATDCDKLRFAVAHLCLRSRFFPFAMKGKAKIPKLIHYRLRKKSFKYYLKLAVMITIKKESIYSI